MAAVVLAGAVAALVGQLLVEALMGPLNIPAPGDTGPTAPLRLGASVGVAAIASGLALLLTRLLAYRLDRAVRIAQGVGVAIFLLSLVRVAVSWNDLTTPAGLLVLHTIVAAVILAALDWAFRDTADHDA